MACLAKDRLYVTVYHTDDDALTFGNKDIGLPQERIIAIGDNKGGAYQSDNFWMMGTQAPAALAQRFL